MLTIDKIIKAAETLKPVIRKTDLIHSNALSKNNEIYLKAENLQITGSFKVRGAYVKIAGLSDAQKAKGGFPAICVIVHEMSGNGQERRG